jgi:hypothetical protein
VKSEDCYDHLIALYDAVLNPSTLTRDIYQHARDEADNLPDSYFPVSIRGTVLTVLRRAEDLLELPEEERLQVC